jgi:transposase
MSKRSRDQLHMQYSADTKHNILTQYKPGVRGCGFTALANRYNIKGGNQLIQLWYNQWNGTPQSLEKHTTSHKKRKLNERDVHKYITRHVVKMNEGGEAVDYTGVKKNVKLKKGKSIPLRTIQRYGKKAGLSYKRTTRTLISQGIYTHIHHCSLASVWSLIDD